MTANTNQKTRNYVDKIIKNLGLVLGDVNYLEHYETIQRHIFMHSSKRQVTKSMISICGCKTIDQVEVLNNINKNTSLDNFLKTIWSNVKPTR